MERSKDSLLVNQKQPVCVVHETPMHKGTPVQDKMVSKSCGPEKVVDNNAHNHSPKAPAKIKPLNINPFEPVGKSF